MRAAGAVARGDAAMYVGRGATKTSKAVRPFGEPGPGSWDREFGRCGGGTGGEGWSE